MKSSTKNSYPLAAIDTSIAQFIEQCNNFLYSFINTKKHELEKRVSRSIHEDNVSKKLYPGNVDNVDSRISDDFSMLFEPLENLLRGGKRTRASLVFLGYLAFSNRESKNSHSDESPELSLDSKHYNQLVEVASALELFQLAALIHDDIIDQAPTRRGLKSAHIYYKDSVRNYLESQEASEFGYNSALLLGDIVLSFAQEAFMLIFDENDLSQEDLSHLINTQKLFHAMHSEVMLGQFFDVAAESNDLNSMSLPQTELIMILKSALYSVVYPLQLGACLAGVDEDTLKTIEHFALPLGKAFQLRDDILGVFGNENKTGKSAGTDLIEGKRTWLVSSAYQNNSSQAKKDFENILGNPKASNEQLEILRGHIKDTGTLKDAEKLIEHLTHESIDAIPDFINSSVKNNLISLAHNLTQRNM